MSIKMFLQMISGLPLEHIESVKSVTAKMFISVLIDNWPSPAACVDFGVDSQLHYEALYYPIRAGEISEVELDKVLGNGPEITKLVQSCESNPHKDIVFQTSYDCMEVGLDDEEGEGNGGD